MKRYLYVLKKLVLEKDQKPHAALFKRCYFLHDICDSVEKYYLHGFSNALDSVYAAVVYCHFKVGIIPLNKSITIPQLPLLGSFILSNLIRSVYNSLSAVIFIELTIFSKLIYFTLMD